MSDLPSTEDLPQLVADMQLQLKQQQQQIVSLQSGARNLGGNLNFLRDLVEESVHLTEQTSGIVVEHVTTLDRRMDSVGTIFTDKIKRTLKEMGETNLMEHVVGQVELDESVESEQE